MEDFVRTDKAAGWEREKRVTQSAQRFCTEVTEEKNPGKIQSAVDGESTEFTALLRSPGKWLQIKGPKESGLLFGVAPSDHELLFVIIDMLYQRATGVSIVENHRETLLTYIFGGDASIEQRHELPDGVTGEDGHGNVAITARPATSGDSADSYCRQQQQRADHEGAHESGKKPYYAIL